MAKFTVRVWGEHSDPVVVRSFRSKRAAEKFADEWRSESYVTGYRAEMGPYNRTERIAITEKYTVCVD